MCIRDRHFAARAGLAEIVDILLFSKKFDINAQNVHLETPLHLACRQGSVKLISVLLNSNPSLNLINLIGEKPRDCARSNEVIQMLDIFAHASNHSRTSHPQTSPLIALNIAANPNEILIGGSAYTHELLSRSVCVLNRKISPDSMVTLPIQIFNGDQIVGQTPTYNLSYEREILQKAEEDRLASIQKEQEYTKLLENIAEQARLHQAQKQQEKQQEKQKSHEANGHGVALIQQNVALAQQQPKQLKVPAEQEQLFMYALSQNPSMDPQVVLLATNHSTSRNAKEIILWATAYQRFIQEYPHNRVIKALAVFGNENPLAKKFLQTFRILDSFGYKDELKMTQAILLSDCDVQKAIDELSQ
eukprot:TRINITY_DN13527_c0_g1_i1.p1 TRINITY_DN13527_c0_g1~~TRINITY_DN13527_c0_g1_i1.p1  ORF type:complete len:360 (-),score=61.36 TRINITY_DN13527_c0_g1_i1:164-1243(-)